jgi:hypothetical protein
MLVKANAKTDHTCTDVQHAGFALAFEMVWDVEWG